MARGGRRTGTPGTAYGNRTDLNQAPSGGQYGDKAAAQARLAAVPITPPPAMPAPQGAPQQPLAPPPPIDRPSERPLEPITTGLPTGPGAGPEALNLPDANTTLRQTLQGMAATSPAVAQLAAYVNSGRA